MDELKEIRRTNPGINKLSLQKNCFLAYLLGRELKAHERTLDLQNGSKHSSVGDDESDVPVSSMNCGSNAGTHPIEETGVTRKTPAPSRKR